MSPGTFEADRLTFASCNHLLQHVSNLINRSGFLALFRKLVVLTIPVRLLWRVRIKPSQKLGLGVFLCLSIGMILMAITRLSGVHSYRGSFDEIWILLWQQIEACIAVTMLSLTAFRSVFVEAKPGSDKAIPSVP